MDLETIPLANFLIGRYNLLQTDGFAKLRAKAWERFGQVGLPSLRSDNYHYIPLKRLYEHSLGYTTASHAPIVNRADLEPSILPECQNSVLVFVDGHFCPELSNWTALPPSVVISTLTEGNKRFTTFFSNRWTQLAKEEQDPLSLLNAALFQEGLFIYLPPKVIVEVPLQILHVTTRENEGLRLLFPRIELFAGKSSSLQLIHTVLDNSQDTVVSIMGADLVLEEQAAVQQSVLRMQHRNEWIFDIVRVTLKRDSNFKGLLLTDGAHTVRQDYRMELLGENSEASLEGISLLQGNKHSHTYVHVDHQAPHCRSNQKFKTVLMDNARSSFEGKIYIHSEAQKTEAFQLSNNLLLSEQAIAYARPNLEIFADDVKASHGATVGSLDLDSLFYLQSRGIPAKKAKGILIHGFCQEVIDHLTIPSAQEKMQKWLNQFLGYDHE
jgi:Fe-S cluster assembly protein SufD